MCGCLLHIPEQTADATRSDRDVVGPGLRDKTKSRAALNDEDGRTLPEDSAPKSAIHDRLFVIRAYGLSTVRDQFGVGPFHGAHSPP
jgi:hypothetical protein